MARGEVGKLNCIVKIFVVPKYYSGKLHNSLKGEGRFNSELSKTADNRRIIFLVDGDRNAIYQKIPGSKTDEQQQDVDLFLRLAKERGFETIDMQPIFEQHWLDYHERMDFLPIDGHWNPVAHRLAADAILKKLEKRS